MKNTDKESVYIAILILENIEYVKEEKKEIAITKVINILKEILKNN